MSLLKNMPDRCPHCGQIENRAPATSGLLRWFTSLCVGALFVFLIFRALAVDGIVGLLCLAALVFIGAYLVRHITLFGIPGPMSDEAYEREDEVL